MSLVTLKDNKSMKEDIYKKYTGKSNKMTRKWLEYIVEHKLQNKCVIRIPRIFNYTSEEDVEYSVQCIRRMGFERIDRLEYIITDTL